MKDFVTEKEAKYKSCPFLEGGVTMSFDKDNKATIPAGIDDRAYPNCLASKCMAWRWSHQDTGVNDPPTGFCGAAVSPKYI